MNWPARDSSDDYQPLFWLAGVAVYGVTALVALLCASMVFCALLQALGSGLWLEKVVFSGYRFWEEQHYWTPITYVFFNQPSIWFVIGMLMFYWFGRDVEKFIGRSAFLVLCALLVLVPGLVFVSLSWWFKIVSYGGMGMLHLGIFTAFVTIYPNVDITLGFVFRILAKWVLAVLLLIYSLQALASRDWLELLTVWMSAGLGFGFMRYLGVGGGLGWVGAWWENRRVEAEARKRQFHVVKAEEKQKSIDEILEKISRQGLVSLTSAEKATLEKARTELLEKDRGRK
jgi:membrane associated rhomboid family serine protease